MALAHIVNAYPDELVCDMAEVYSVYDWRALPLVTAATLAQGLPASSRVMRLLSGGLPDAETMLLAMIVDRLGHIAWMFSEDGAKRLNHPPSILEAITDRTPKQDLSEGFDSSDAFFAAWAQITGGENNNG